jgi:multidrug efflux pump subunit AcrB
LNIHVDRVKAALEGIDADAVTKALDSYLSGTVVTQIATGIKIIGVRVWIPGALRKTDTDVGNLRIRAPDGHLFPLSRVATIEAVTGQPQIARENLKQMVAVTSRISGRDLGSVIADVKQVMAQPGTLPAGAYFVLGGLYEQQQIAFQGLMSVFAAAVALVFLLLLFLYESFRLAIAILVTALLAVSAVFIGLWITHTELNISAMMGMTMIIGMVTMTTMAAILTLLPLAFALGQGSEMQQPLAIAIISGLVVQLPLVLLVMPVLFHLMRNRHPESEQNAATPATQ